MKPEQIKLIRNSWSRIMPIRDKAAELFYKRLFELDPDLEDLFEGNMEEQGTKLMSMITVAVNSLDRFDSFEPVLRDLGKRHVGYGVLDKDYNTVAEALIWTLALGLGEGFTDEVKEAWVVAYTTMTDTMKEAAYEAA